MLQITPVLLSVDKANAGIAQGPALSVEVCVSGQVKFPPHLYVTINTNSFFYVFHIPGDMRYILASYAITPCRHVDQPAAFIHTCGRKAVYLRFNYKGLFRRDPKLFNP